MANKESVLWNIADATALGGSLALDVALSPFELNPAMIPVKGAILSSVQELPNMARVALGKKTWGDVAKNIAAGTVINSIPFGKVAKVTTKYGGVITKKVGSILSDTTGPIMNNGKKLLKKVVPDNVQSYLGKVGSNISTPISEVSNFVKEVVGHPVDNVSDRVKQAYSAGKSESNLSTDIKRNKFVQEILDANILTDDDRFLTTNPEQIKKNINEIVVKLEDPNLTYAEKQGWQHLLELQYNRSAPLKGLVGNMITDGTTGALLGHPFGGAMIGLTRSLLSKAPELGGYTAGYVANSSVPSMSKGLLRAVVTPFGEDILSMVGGDTKYTIPPMDNKYTIPPMEMTNGQ
jgi:hypothetical protein